MPLQFRPGCSEHVMRTAREVYDAFSELHDKQIIVRRGFIRGSTMQAQPVVNIRSILRGFSAYRLKIAQFVRDSTRHRVDRLDEEVLTGWLAHEFGHLHDYQKYSVIGMAIYGLRYVFSKSFAKAVEKRADIHAIEHGFYHEVRKTKEFLLSNQVSPEYQQKLKGRYLSIEELDVCNTEFEGRLPDQLSP